MDNPPKRKPTVTKPGSSFRPRVQTQPNRPQPHSQPQPHHRFQSQPNRPQGVYRPQMYDSSSPLMDYNQPLPPLPEDWFEQVHTVPETPMYNVEEVDDEEMEVEELGAEEEQVVVEVESRPKKAEKRKWESEEEEALAKSWIKISTDKLVGDRQTKEGFWKRVLKHYQSLIPGSNRTKDQVNSKWTLMNAAMVAFNGYYSQALKSVETSSSTRDSVEVYTAEKTILLKAQLEAQRKKDEKYLKFIETEEYNRDMKFVMDPHEHIQDPAFKEFIINRKREFCAKYGWPCSL